MKKTSLIALLLVLVLSFGFAAGKTNNLVFYHTEGFDAGVSRLGAEDFGWHMGLADGGVKFGMKTVSGAVNADLSMDASMLVSRLRAPGSSSNVELDIDLDAAYDVNLRLEGFKSDMDGHFIIAGAKNYDAFRGRSLVYKSLEGLFNANFAFEIPVKDGGFFHFYEDNALQVTSDIGGDDTYVRADILPGFGYFIPSENKTSEESFDLAYKLYGSEYCLTPVRLSDMYNVFTNLDAPILDYSVFESKDEAKNNLKFYSVLSVPMTIEKDFFCEDVFIDTNYNIAFAPKDNILSFNLSLSESSEFNRGAWYTDFGFGADVSYMYRESWGKNAIDTLKVDAEAKADVNVSLQDGAIFNSAILAGVYFPRIIPVEKLDNFSLALPTQVMIEFANETSAKFSDSIFAYGVKMTPFYVEVKNGLKFFNLYLNTVKYDIEYQDAYFWGRNEAGGNYVRVLKTGFDLNFDTKQSVTDNNTGLKAGFTYNFVDKTNSVTIAFDSKF